MLTSLALDKNKDDLECGDGHINEDNFKIKTISKIIQHKKIKIQTAWKISRNLFAWP